MGVLDLWLPIVATGVVTHIASTLAWTVLPHHKPEWRKLPAEDDLLDLLDEKQVAAAQYLFPFAENSQEMNTPEYVEKLKTRCRGMIVLWSTPPNMGLAIGLTFGFFMVVAFVLGYLNSIAFGPTATRLDVFRFTFAAAALVHCLGPYPHAFWFRRRTLLEVVDGVVYSLISAGVFAMLVPVGSDS